MRMLLLLSCLFVCAGSASAMIWDDGTLAYPSPPQLLQAFALTAVVEGLLFFFMAMIYWDAGRPFRYNIPGGIVLLAAAAFQMAILLFFVPKIQYGETITHWFYIPAVLINLALVLGAFYLATFKMRKSKVYNWTFNSIFCAVQLIVIVFALSKYAQLV